jgi:diguanylate cyclase
MADVKKEITKLKKDLIDIIESRREERELMIEVINSLHLLATGQEDISDKIRQIRDEIVPDGDISFEGIRSLGREIKDKLIERERISGDEELNRIEILTERFIDSCRVMKRIMAAILEDFYPLPDEMQKTADSIRVECKGDPAEIEIKKPSDDLLEFIDKIKIIIAKDFNEINNTFLSLLGQVKDLEKSLINDFGNENNIKEIENFETDINQQVGNIAESFNSYTTINELKEVVIGKLKKIKDLVSLRKKKEFEKTEAAMESIKQLNQRINTVEKKARQMSAKAKAYQKAAMRDGLTGLYTRGAFDVKIKEAFENFTTGKKDFSIIVFDVNKFKQINDTLGHIAGDKVLKKIAECLEESFRKNDFIARYGGDEFIVVIEELSEEMANERIDVFNRNLKKRRFVSQKHGEVKLSVSAGTSKIMENDTIESLIDRADKAMYDSKQETA